MFAHASSNAHLLHSSDYQIIGFMIVTTAIVAAVVKLGGAR